MTSNTSSFESGDEHEDDLLAVFGNQNSAEDGLVDLIERRRKFAPWHHPVKQIVRDRQWANLTARLLRDRPASAAQVLRYFTLPGEDLLDIKVLADACAPLGIRIEYFGFNSTQDKNGDVDEHATSRAPWVTAESALRQSDRVTPDAIIHSDRMEDIALDHSHAANQLKQRGPFDVINIDACDHLAYRPKGRQSSTFDALQALLRHQMGARNSWLLFLTTRVDPVFLGPPGIEFQQAITQNLGVPGSPFGAALAECLGAEEIRLKTELSTAWETHDVRFLKLYSVGIGKFLLQFFCGQPNWPSNVELASVYAYRVHNTEPDMLSLAFRITPDPPRVFPPSIGGAAIIPALEPVRAVRVAEKAARLWDIDEALQRETEVRASAIANTQKLLNDANYDLEQWKHWLSTHERRPLTL